MLWESSVSGSLVCITLVLLLLYYAGFLLVLGLVNTTTRIIEDSDIIRSLGSESSCSNFPLAAQARFLPRIY